MMPVVDSSLMSSERNSVDLCQNQDPLRNLPDKKSQAARTLVRSPDENPTSEFERLAKPV